MQDKRKQQILDAFLVVVRPIVRILLRYGIGYREFLEVIKTAYVDIASSDFGLRGRPTNISRVAVMTGLTRKEVRRLRDKIAEGGEVISVKATPMTDVLHYWHADAEFMAASGRPLTLPFAGEKGSFSSLVRRFGGDIPPGAMRTEMKRVAAVLENEDGTLTITKRDFRPSEDHDNLVMTLIHAVYPLLSTTIYNTDPARSSEAWANRVAHTRMIRSGDSGRLRRIIRERIREFSESIDDIFIAYESIHDEQGDDDDSDAIAVGVFYFEERDQNVNYEW